MYAWTGSCSAWTGSCSARVTGRLDSLDARTKQLEVRTGSIEHNLLNLNTRMDVLSDDMRQRFRVLNDRLAGAA
jgi:hypothetical protein